MSMLQQLLLRLLLLTHHAPTTKIYTLSLHDALPISNQHMNRSAPYFTKPRRPISPSLYEKITGGSASRGEQVRCERDRKSTRLNSSHLVISYAVFCLKKKMKRY